MVKKITGLMAMLFTVMLFSAYGQSGRVQGVVSDRASGLTLPGASVIVEGTTIGSTTGVNGEFSFEVPTGNVTLIASFIGYSPTRREITVSAGETVRINFELYPDITILDEFIVIGYGVQRREDATGAVSVVGERDFNRGNITTPSELLMGKMAGVQITSGGGGPGEGATIRIRGGSSLSALNDPLFVIDGVPVDSRGISGMRNPLSMINPNDIETFTVLKDASATAIYGSRASNGVVIITTKSGRMGDPLRLNYSGTYSLSTNAQRIDVLGADDFRNLLNERFAGNESVLGLMGESSTNWQDQIFRDAFGHDHNLSATGSYGNVPYRASLGYSSTDGVLLTDNLTRTTLSLGANPSLFNDQLSINFNARGAIVENQFAPRGAIGEAIQFDPTQPVMDPNSTFGGYFTWADPTSDIPKDVATYNPVARINLTDDNSTVNRIIGNVQFDYKLPFLTGLRANLNLGYDYSKSDGSLYIPDFAPFNYVRGGTDLTYGQEKKNELIDFYLNYVTQIEPLRSRIDIMGGYSWQHFWMHNTSQDRNIANNLAFQRGHSNDSLRIFEPISRPTENYLISFFGRLNYSLMDRYLFTFTLRNDGSSRFVGDNQWGLFPAAALAWRLDQENFLRNSTLISELKLRVGAGITGQQELEAGDYPALARYTGSIRGGYYFFGDEQITTLRPEGYDENLKWEETTTYNIGLDYGFARDRFTGSLDFYFRETKDLLNRISIPAGTNLTNIILTNIGNMENRGVEFSINTRPVVTPDLVWNLGLNATYNETKITKLIAAVDENYLGVLTGGISGGVGAQIQIHSEQQAPNSFFVYQQVYDTNGNPIEGVYVDRNRDGEITDDDRYHHRKPAADYYFGINSGFEYRNWFFSFAGRANIGNFMYNNVSSMDGNYSRLYRNEGPYLSNVTTDVHVAGFNNPQYWSDFYIQDGSFFKMDNITLSHNFRNIVDRANMVVSFTVQNAFIITRYEGLDPEIPFGIDNRFYPRPRNFVLGLNLQF
jgi:TonB-dependent starch-binding outer membrane protein SusC